MIHKATSDFWQLYEAPPAGVRRVADRNFELMKRDPKHPSLHFKQTGRVWSARVGIGWRALATRHDDELLWFWIGSHADYDKLLNR